MNKTLENNTYNTSQADDSRVAPLSNITDSQKVENKKKRKADNESLPRHSKRRRCTRWTSEENERLRIAFEKYNGKHWKLIAAEVGNKNEDQCNQHWYRVLDPNIAKSKWAPSEDQLLMSTVDKHGSSAWKKISACLPGRTDLQCRHRWTRLMKKREQAQKAKEAKQRKSGDSSFSRTLVHSQQPFSNTLTQSYNPEDNSRNEYPQKPQLQKIIREDTNGWGQPSNLHEECNSLDSNSTSDSPGRRLKISNNHPSEETVSMNTPITRGNMNSLGQFYSSLDSSCLDSNANISHLYNAPLVRMHPCPPLTSVHMDAFCSPTHPASPLTHSFPTSHNTHPVSQIQVPGLQHHMAQSSMGGLHQMSALHNMDGKHMLSDVQRGIPDLYFNRPMEVNEYFQKPMFNSILSGSSPAGGRMLNHDFSDLIGKNGNMWNSKPPSTNESYSNYPNTNPM